MNEVTTQRIVPETELPLNLNDHRAPLWWGMVGLVLIELTVFMALISSYFYLRFYNPVWPLGGIEPPELLLPSISTVLLLASSAPVYWADQSMRKGEIGKLKIGLSLGLVLALAFLTLKFIEYSAEDFTWATNAYGSIVWAIVGFHSAHVIALLLKTFVVLAAAFKGYFGEGRNVGVQINGLYWHFVVAIWIPLFFTLYLSHRVFG